MGADSSDNSKHSELGDTENMTESVEDRECE